MYHISTLPLCHKRLVSRSLWQTFVSLKALGHGNKGSDCSESTVTRLQADQY